MAGQAVSSVITRLHDTTGISLETAMPSERSQTQKATSCRVHQCEMSRVDKSSDRKQICGSQGLEGGCERRWEVTANGHGLFWGDEDVLEQTEVMIAQHCECAKCH